MDGNPRLIAHLEELIARRVRIPFSDYMAAVLYHPEEGYYNRASSPIGAEGDFYTAADLDPAMGRLLADLFARMAAGVGGDDFTVVEIGAGTGRLARQVLEHRAFPYVIVEASPAMRERQRAMLEGFPVRWADALPEGLRGCVFSNEFFDALPVRRFVRRGGRVRELFVGAGFAEVEDEPDPPIELPRLAEGARADLSPEWGAWVRRIAGAVESGYHLAIDYGYLEDEFYARTHGTLMCYRRHRADPDPYSDIGEKDITAHVNFSDLIRAGRESGLDPAGYATQMDFLVDLGILDVIEPLASKGDAASIRRVQAMKNMLVPPMMGERFRVLLQRKGVPAEGDSTGLPGFRKASRI